MLHASVSCFWLLKHVAACALNLALDKAGSSIAARIAMIAMTTSNSIRVKAQVLYSLELFARCKQRFDSETLGTDWDCMNIRKESNRQYYHLNLCGPEKAAGIPSLRCNTEAATMYRQCIHTSTA